MEEQNVLNNTNQSIEKNGETKNIKKMFFFGFVFLLVIGGGILVKVLDVKVNVEESDKNSKITTTVSTPTSKSTTKPMENVTELKIEDIKVGTGEEVKAGDKAVVHYRGTLLDGTQFDASYDRGAPFAFNLGKGEVIEGWDKGVAGMKVGGKRKLTIPSDLGYGPIPMGSIPANSTLVFEVELVKIEK